MLKKIVLIAVCIFCVGNFLLAQGKENTVSKNVCVLDTAFKIPQLNRTRRIWIYLPESYCNSRKKYPVLYLHDGQNVFNNATSYAGEWGVDEALDTLGALVQESIVVAIDNGGDKRMNEYTPYDTTLTNNNTTLQIKGEGDLYIDFIVNTLKSYVDKHFKTKKSRKYTFVAGSSMGGLISLYAQLKYPKVFGGAGVFSPSFWVAPQISNAIRAKGKKVKGKVYFYSGKGEGENMVPDMLSVFELMNKYTKAKMTTVIRTEGKHSEESWRKEFPFFYKWMFSSK